MPRKDILADQPKYDKIRLCPKCNTPLKDWLDYCPNRDCGFKARRDSAGRGANRETCDTTEFSKMKWRK